MSLPLRDLRAKITPEADVALEARAKALRRDKSELVREVLHAWALQELRVANVLLPMARVEGIEGSLRE